MGFLRVLTLALVVVALLGGQARGHGDFAMPHQVVLHPSDPSKMAIGTNFGLILTSDGGATWRWICEAPYLMGVLYYLPVYGYTSTSALLVTTPTGLFLSRDGGCNWSRGPGEMASHFGATIVNGPGDSIWVATQTADVPNDVYVSRDDATSFAPTGPTHAGAQWHSLRIAPGDPMRIYLTGHEQPAADDATPNTFLFYRSDDGGASWSGGTVSLAYSDVLRFQLLDVSPADANLVFARVNMVEVDALMRSDDGGTTWTEVLMLGQDVSSVAVKADGQMVISGSPVDGTYVSTNAGLSFTRSTETPHLGCAARLADDTVLGCGVLPDNFVIAASSDGASWSPMLRFCDVVGPIDCPTDSPFGATCPIDWPTTAAFFGVPCGSAAADGGMTGGGGGGGSCGCGVAVGLVLSGAGWRRRRTITPAPRRPPDPT